MKRLLVPMVVCFLSSQLTFGQAFQQKFESQDIGNFWVAYDKIVSVKDSAQQYQFLREFYINKASPGLRGFMQVRNYSEKEFIDAIHRYPEFWRSIRANTLNSGLHYSEIEADIRKLKQLYPSLTPATIYFCVGAFRSGGTIQGNKVLVGSELSLVDETAVISEHPEWRQAFYKEYKPAANIALMCTHEYVHTQQKPYLENLLSMCLYEGVAEFVSCNATGKKSNSPAIEFGKLHEAKVVDQYVKDLFLMSNNNNWLWGQNRNHLQVRDLGYYIGYEICERYYQQSEDKTKAIKELIELDYNNEKEVERIVDKTKLLPSKLSALYNDYEKQRPTIISVAPFRNGSKKVKPGKTTITVSFSEPLNGQHTSIDFGPLGKEAFPQIKPERIWSADAKTWTFEADLKPNQHYQILISNNFRKQNGVRLKPYLIDFKTGK